MPGSPEATEVGILDQDELWQDVTPIPQPDAERPMVQIAYHPDYSKAMDLFRALVKQNEFSKRALDLTTEILEANGSHYTVWSYRLRVLKHLHEADPAGEHLQKELSHLDELMPYMRKSYQIWQHRASVVAILGDPSKELDFVNEILKADPKNYHTWTYRQNLLCQYNRPEMWAGEVPFTEELLDEDIRNNSVWNHRFFLIFDTINLHQPSLRKADFKALADHEIEFAKQRILIAPNNPSAWNYLRGVFKRARLPLSGLEAFVRPLTKTAQELDAEACWPAGLNKLSNLPVSAAVELLADILAETKSNTDEALALYHQLAEKLDPIRKGYWDYRCQVAVRSAATTS